MLTPRCWAILILAAAILITCYLIEWRHQLRTKRGKLRDIRHLAQYHPDGWRHL